MDRIEIGEKLRELRGSMTQKQLGEAIGVADSTIGMYEKGKRVPKDDIKFRYAHLFGKTVQELFYMPNDVMKHDISREHENIRTEIA